MADRYASLKQGLVGCWIPSISGSGLLLPDLSGRGNNGSLVNMDASDWVSSGSGRALDFDGSDDWINLGDVLGFAGSNQTISISWWAYLKTANDAMRPFSKCRNSLTNSGWEVASYLDAGVYYVYWFSANALSPNRSFVQAIASGSALQWRHYAITFNAALGASAGTKIYENTALLTNQVLESGSTVIAANALTAKISASDSTASPGTPIGFTPAVLDDIRIYNRALTEPEIKLLASDRGIGFKPNKKLSRFSTRYTYQPPKPRNYSVIRNRDPNYSTLRQGLVAAYCPSISGQGNVLPDLVGGNHGTLTNMSAGAWVSSGSGRALQFTGTDTQGGNDTQNRVTLAKDFGVDIIGFSGWINPIALNKRGICASWPSNTAPRFAITLLTNGTLEVYRGQNTQSTAALSTNRWQHIFVFSDGNNTSYYIDGVFSNTANQQGISPGLQTNFLLGNNYWGALEGYLDDVRVYDRHLTLAEIKLLASKRGIGLEPRKPKITFTDLGVQKTYSVVRVKETDYATLRQGLVGAWCPSLANGGSGNTLADVSGYGNHGTLTNMSPDDWVSGQYGRALDIFDDQYIDGGAMQGLSLAYPFSMSCWIQNITSNNVDFSPFAKTRQVGTYQGPMIYFASATNATVVAYWAGGTRATGATVVTQLSNWTHVGICWTGSQARVYVNGRLDGTGNTATAPNASTASVNIGRYNSEGFGQRSMRGRIDDCRIYDRCLTDSEWSLLASRPGIGLRQESHRQTFYQFPSGARRKRILTGMP